SDTHESLEWVNLVPVKIEDPANGWDDSKEFKQFITPTSSDYSGLTDKEIEEWEEITRRNTEHNGMTWTACYDDHCWVHQGEKVCEGWFPQELRKRRTCDQVRSWNNYYRQSCKKHKREEIAAGDYPKINGGKDPLPKRDEVTRKR